MHVIIGVMELILIAIAAISIVSAGLVAIKISLMKRKFKMKQLLTGAGVLDDMPSVSVCIPARNETHAMTECLDRVIASVYPKLEIIVTDDSSTDNTPALIKAYAHAGVRFVGSEKLPAGWLGKNHALQVLSNKASGHYILYMDVDTRIDAGTVGQLVSYIEQEQVDMISVLPRRNDGLRLSVLFSPLRYFWTIVLNRQARPAVASNAWMIKRKVLQDLGGIEPIKSLIAPETELAALLHHENRYSFVISTPLLGVAFEKRWHSQVDTSIRLTFPLLGKSIAKTFLSVLVLAAVLASFILPIFLGVYGALAAALVYLAWLVAYALYTSAVWRSGWVLGAALWPLLIIQEITLIITSAIKHMLGTVTWKGRPVSVKAQ